MGRSPSNPARHAQLHPVPRPWIPRQVLATPAGLALPVGRAIAARATALGARLVELPADRLTNLPDTYRDAKTTLALVVASPGRRRLQPIALRRLALRPRRGLPRALRLLLPGGLAEGAADRARLRQPRRDPGRARRRPRRRSGGLALARPRRQGTTFECSCYTDPLALEHLTGALARAVTWFGAWDAPVHLRFTTKFDAVDKLLALPHHGRTRIRFSVNALAAMRHEGGGRGWATGSRHSAAWLAGYPVGLTVAPILRLPDWEAEYDRLFAAVAAALAGVPAPDLTAELITHRFTPGSREVLTGWYPGSDLEMDEATRARKTTKFGSTKFAFPRGEKRSMRAGIEASLARHLPAAARLYWTRAERVSGT